MNTSHQQLNSNEDQISIIDFFKKLNSFYIFLKSKSKILLLSMILGASLGIVFAISKTPTYSANLTFALEDDKGGGGNLSGALGLASSFGIDIGGGGGAFAASNLIELMKSRLIIEKVLLSPIKSDDSITTLADFYIKMNNLNKNWSKNNNLSNFSFNKKIINSRIQDSILNVIYENLFDDKNILVVQKDKKVSILSIIVKSKNETFSKVFCENLAKVTSNFYIETKSKKSKLNVSVLQRQVDSIRFELKNSINGVAKETDNVYNLNPSFVRKGTSSKIHQVDVQANTSILSNLVVQLELAKITLRKETPLIQIIDTPKYPLQKNKSSLILYSIIGAIIFFISNLFLLIFRRYYFFYKNLL